MEPEVYESPDVPVSSPSTAGVAGSKSATSASVTSSSSSSSSPSYKVDDIVDYTVNAKDSFEVFMGRRYDPAERYLSPLLSTDSLVAQQEILYPSHPHFDKLATYLTTTLENGLPSSSTATAMHSQRNVPKRLETPLMKYSRLIEEVHILQKELQTIQDQDNHNKNSSNSSSSSNTKGKHTSTNITTTPIDHNTGVFRLLTTGTKALDSHLQSIQSTVQTIGHKTLNGNDTESIALPKASIESIKALQTDIRTLRETQQVLLDTVHTVTTKLVSMEQSLNRILQDTAKI